MPDIVISIFRLENDRGYFVPKFDIHYIEKETGIQWFINCGGIPLGTSDFEDFVNDWLQMQQTSGIIEKLYNKWILGTKAEQKKRR